MATTGVGAGIPRCKIALPSTLSREDGVALFALKGCFVFVKSYQMFAKLDDVWFVRAHGAAWTATEMENMSPVRNRLLAVVDSVGFDHISLIMIGMSLNARYKIKNTGPFPLRNGQRVCLLPPVFGDKNAHVIRLPSIGKEIVLPVTVPDTVANDVMIKLNVAMFVRLHALGDPNNRMDAERALMVHHEGRKVSVADVALSHEEALEYAMRLASMCSYVCVESAMPVRVMLDNLWIRNPNHALLAQLAALRIRGPVPVAADGDGPETVEGITRSLTNLISACHVISERNRVLPVGQVCSVEGDAGFAEEGKYVYLITLYNF